MPPSSREPNAALLSRDPLLDFWYPVALSTAVTSKPVAAKLHGVSIVLWRSADRIMAFRDLCIHRGTRLSLGWMEGGELICPYHGWAFGCDGGVTRIPALPAERPIPEKARAEAYLCQERYGLVFVCMGTPVRDIYNVPEFEDAAFITHLVGPTHWHANAFRSLENFMDEAHLPWAHAGSLGNRAEVPTIPVRDVTMRDDGFYFETTSEVRNRVDNTMSLNRLTYDIQMPLTVYHENIYPGDRRVIDLFFVTPNEPEQSTRYMVVARNFALDQPTQKFIDFTNGIWEEDRILIESQMPELLPMDWDAELHLRGPDQPSILYRTKLKELLQRG